MSYWTKVQPRYFRNNRFKLYASNYTRQTHIVEQSINCSTRKTKCYYPRAVHATSYFRHFSPLFIFVVWNQCSSALLLACVKKSNVSFFSFSVDKYIGLLVQTFLSKTKTGRNIRSSKSSKFNLSYGHERKATPRRCTSGIVMSRIAVNNGS